LAAASASSAAPFRTVANVPPPTVHLTWNAPYGSPRAKTRVSPACNDSTRLDTLWLTFETPVRGIHHTAVSGTVLFEPADGDTLGSFWAFERGGPNAGNILIDFDLLPDPDRSFVSPYSALVNGHVGYTRAGGRGRLDLTANGPGANGGITQPGAQYCFARIIIREQRTDLTGCERPIAVRWAGARFQTSMEGDLRVTQTAGTTVCWNAARGGVARRRPAFVVETWVPKEAPPSRMVIANPNQGTPRVTLTRIGPASADTTTGVR
jgi:hypothetical protein